MHKISKFLYEMKSIPLTMVSRTNYDSNTSTILVGKNGVGKSRLLSSMVKGVEREITPSVELITVGESLMTTIKIMSKDFASHIIEIVASRRDEKSKWTLDINITLPDGTNLPAKKISDQSFGSLDEAFEGGFEIAKEMVK